MLAKAPGVKAFSARTKGSKGWSHPFWECPLPIIKHKETFYDELRNIETSG
jgi:hypothetical protein